VRGIWQMPFWLFLILSLSKDAPTVLQQNSSFLWRHDPMAEAQAMEEAPFRSVDDIGVRVPKSMPLPVDPELQAMVAKLAGITRGAGIVMAAQEVAADPTPAGKLRTVLALLKLLVFGRMQQTVDEVVREAPKLGCGAGCAYCCYHSVETTIPEAILVAAQLADPADARRRKVLDTAGALHGVSESERRRRGTPCPLLVDNRCSVYEDRPLMCRAMLAVDAGECRASHVSALAGKGDRPIEHFPAAQYFALGDQAGMRGILKDMGLQHDLVELTQAVAAILRDPAIIDRWLAGERVFGPGQILAEQTAPVPA
jgi:Fe-S-cluster containining protein